MYHLHLLRFASGGARSKGKQDLLCCGEVLMCPIAYTISCLTEVLNAVVSSGLLPTHLHALGPIRISLLKCPVGFGRASPAKRLLMHVNLLNILLMLMRISCPVKRRFRGGSCVTIGRILIGRGWLGHTRTCRVIVAISGRYHT